MRRALFALLLAMLWARGLDAMTIERVISPSGIEAWLSEDHTLPVVSIRFAFPGGAALDPAGKAGLAIGQSLEAVEDWPRRIGEVTPAEVDAAARALFVERNSATGVLLPERGS